MTTINEIEKRLENVLELKQKYSEYSAMSKRVYSELQNAQAELASVLESNDLTSYRSAKGINFSYSYQPTIRTPKSIEDKIQLFNFFSEKEGKDFAWSVFGINSQTANSIYKEQASIAASEGNFDFKIPGLELGEPLLKFSIRKKGEKND